MPFCEENKPFDLNHHQILVIDVDRSTLFHGIDCRSKNNFKASWLLNGARTEERSVSKKS